MKYELKGQADIKLAIGAPGDKTIIVAAAVGSTHAQIKNLSPNQAILYSVDAAPAWPGGWHRCDPEELINILLTAGAVVNIRKWIWNRAGLSEYMVATAVPGIMKADVQDVGVEVEVSFVKWA